MIGISGGSVGVFIRMVSMVLVPCGVGAVLVNACGIEWQNYVPLLQGSQISAGFHYGNLILGI